MRLAIAGVALEFLDALSTYIITMLGLGYEANPRLSFINDAPVLVFPIFLAQAAFVGGVGLLAWLEKRRGFMRAYYVTAMPLAFYLAHKAMVVVNNVSVAVFGFSGIDYYFSEAVKFFMVLGGLAYGVFRIKHFKNRNSILKYG
jgi:hypothetical protein